MTPFKSIVTGGAGFIGSHLVDLLMKSGHEVHVIDNLYGGRYSNIEHHRKNKLFYFHEIDILNIKKDSKIFENVSYIFHLAGIGEIIPSIENPDLYFNVNVQGTVRVLEAARQNHIKKFIYAASSSCYGLSEVPTSENAPIFPLYPYAMSKYLGEQIVFHWSRVYNLPVNSICIFNAYGTRLKTNGSYGAVFGVFLKQKLAAKPYTVVGDGNQRRDFVYVTDVARAFLLAAQTNISGERFNLGGGNPRSINELISILGGPHISLPSRPGEPEITFADINKITNLLNWRPEVEFKEGISQMLENIDYWSEAPLWDKNSIETATKSWFEFMSNSPRTV